MRPLPEITSMNAHFWRSGRHGELCLLRCSACSYYVHPPQPVCPRCLSKDVPPVVVSGRGTLFSFTVNHHPWNPTVPAPYIIGLVEIAEQHDVRLTTNIVGCEPDDVRIGMPVRVNFEQEGEVYVPVFTPDVT